MQVRRDALALLLGDLLDAQLRQLSEVALDVGRDFLDAVFERRAALFGRAQRPRELTDQTRADGEKDERHRVLQHRHALRRQQLHLRRELEQQHSRGAGHDQQCRHEVVALAPPGDHQSKPHRCEDFEREQRMPGAGDREDAIRVGPPEARRNQRQLQREPHRDRPRAQSGMAQQKLHCERGDDRKAAAHQYLDELAVERQIGPPGECRYDSPADEQAAEVQQRRFAAVKRIQQQHQTADEQHAGADDLHAADGAEQAARVLTGELGVAADVKLRQRADAMARRDPLQRRRLHPQIEHIALRLQQRRR